MPKTTPGTVQIEVEYDHENGIADLVLGDLWCRIEVWVDDEDEGEIHIADTFRYVDEATEEVFGPPQPVTVGFYEELLRFFSTLEEFQPSEE